MGPLPSPTRRVLATPSKQGASSLTPVLRSPARTEHSSPTQECRGKQPPPTHAATGRRPRGPQLCTAPPNHCAAAEALAPAPPRRASVSLRSFVCTRRLPRTSPRLRPLLRPLLHPRCFSCEPALTCTLHSTTGTSHSQAPEVELSCFAFTWSGRGTGSALLPTQRTSRNSTVVAALAPAVARSALRTRLLVCTFLTAPQRLLCLPRLSPAAACCLLPTRGRSFPAPRLPLSTLPQPTVINMQAS